MIIPDLIAHEYAHSLGHYLSFNPDDTFESLFGEGESGTLEESHADVIGEGVCVPHLVPQGIGLPV